MVLASGAIERPIVFANNDLPGIMLASAAARYAREYAVCCGRRAVVFCNNDSAYAAALALHEAGVTVLAIVDVRDTINAALPLQVLKTTGAESLCEHVVCHASGGKSLRGVQVQAHRDGA